MTAQHTPEPWHREGSFVYALRLDPRHLTYRPNMVNVFSLYVQNDNHIASDEEIEANARLIASAPLMLEALETAVLTLDHAAELARSEGWPESEGRFANDAETVRTAIRAATGEDA